MNFQLDGKKRMIWLLLWDIAGVIAIGGIHTLISGRFEANILTTVLVFLGFTIVQKNPFEILLNGPVLTVRYFRYFFFSSQVQYDLNEITVKRHTETSVKKGRDYMIFYRKSNQLEHIDKKQFIHPEDYITLLEYCRDMQAIPEKASL